MDQRQLQQVQPKVWDWYFGAEQYQHDDRRSMLVREFVDFFGGEVGWELLAQGLQRDCSRQLLILQLDFETLRERSVSA